MSSSDYAGRVLEPFDTFKVTRDTPPEDGHTFTVENQDLDSAIQKIIMEKSRAYARLDAKGTWDFMTARQLFKVHLDDVRAMVRASDWALHAVSTNTCHYIWEKLGGQHSQVDVTIRHGFGGVPYIAFTVDGEEIF